MKEVHVTYTYTVRIIGMRAVAGHLGFRVTSVVSTFGTYPPQSFQLEIYQAQARDAQKADVTHLIAGGILNHGLPVDASSLNTGGS